MDVPIGQEIYIPKSVKRLEFKNCIETSLKGCLHEGLTHLIFHYGCGSNLADCIPKTVRYLVFGNINITKIRKGDIPFGVEYLDVSDEDMEEGSIPNSVIHLKLSCLELDSKICNMIPNS